MTSNDAITGWVAQQLLKVTRTTVTTQLMSGAWPILGLSVHSPEIEVAALPAANEQLADYGLAITRFGNLDINLDDDDNARLKKLAGDTAYSRLAGGFLQAAQAEALQGAGEGMAQGGAAVTPMFLGAGLRHGQPDDAAAGPGRAGRRRPRPGSPAARRATPSRRPRRHRRRRPRRRAARPRAPAATWSARTARARSAPAPSSATRAARRWPSTAPTAMPA